MFIDCQPPHPTKLSDMTRVRRNTKRFRFARYGPGSTVTLLKRSSVDGTEIALVQASFWHWNRFARVPLSWLSSLPGEQIDGVAPMEIRPKPIYKLWP
jgi:hypothetical protein